MKTTKLTALAAAVAMASAPAVFAEVDLYRSEEGSAVPQPTPERPAEDLVELEVGEQLRVYLHTAIEIEKMFFRRDPSDEGESVDQFDNEMEFGIGAEFDQNWEAYFEMEIDNLRDETNFQVGDGDDGGIEITNAWINYQSGSFDGQVGIFRPNLVGDSRIWFREHMVGVRGIYEVSDGLGLEVGTGTLAEEGDDFDEDRQISWISASAGNLYGTLGLFQDNASSEDDPNEIDFGYDPEAADEFGDLYNLAVGWSGDLGNISVSVEYNQNFGEAETGEDFKGRAAYAEFATKLGAHKPRLLLAYGSGDDDANDDEVGEFQEARGDLGWTKLFIEEGGIEQTATDGIGGLEDGDETIGNITLAQIGDTFKVNDVWRTDVSATYLRLSEDNADGDNYLGTELNWLNRWDLPTSREVRLYLDMAYLIAGDAFGPDNIWLVEPGIRVEF